MNFQHPSCVGAGAGTEIQSCTENFSFLIRLFVTPKLLNSVLKRGRHTKDGLFFYLRNRPDNPER